MPPSAAVPASEFLDPLPYAQLQRLSDEQLVEHLQQGNADALAVLFDRYQKLVLSIASKIVKNAGEAEDVSQTVFLDIYKAAGQFDPNKGTTKVWLMQYAYHRALNRRQYLSIRKFYDSSELEELELRRDSTRGIAGLTSVETRRLIREGITELSDKQRTVIELACYQGYTLAEVAEKTGESFINARHHYYRGLAKLRRFVAGNSANVDGKEVKRDGSRAV